MEIRIGASRSHVSERIRKKFVKTLQNIFFAIIVNNTCSNNSSYNLLCTLKNSLFILQTLRIKSLSRRSRIISQTSVVPLLNFFMKDLIAHWSYQSYFETAVEACIFSVQRYGCCPILYLNRHFIQVLEILCTVLVLLVFVIKKVKLFLFILLWDSGLQR